MEGLIHIDPDRVIGYTHGGEPITARDFAPNGTNHNGAQAEVPDQSADKEEGPELRRDSDSTEEQATDA